MAFSSAHQYFDDVGIGAEFESSGRTVTEADVVNFAGLSGDFNPIHIDHEFAKSTPFRRPIAHGLLVYSIGSGLGVHSPLMRTIALLKVQEWSFIGPIFIGDTVHVRTKLKEKIPRGRGKRGEMHWYRSIVNQDGKVVQEGTIITMVEAKPPQRNGDDGSDGNIAL